MGSWQILYELLALLSAAILLGALAERFRQSAIVGYLLAGAIVGPNALGLVRAQENVEVVAELGAALLLFTIGLEFSARRMRQMGAALLGAGFLQVLLTTAICYGLIYLVTREHARSLVLGIMLAMSSTASVLRILKDHATLETPYGRNALGVLLLQDVLVLPLTLIVTAIVGKDDASVLATFTRALLFVLALLVGFYAVLNWIAPRILNTRRVAANRELPIMLAVVMAIGSAYAAHHVGISTAIGAFIAGLMLAESPFAVQIRADVAPLRAVLVTIFFGSIGMLLSPAWTLEHWPMVAVGTLCVVLIKAGVVWAILQLLGAPIGIAIASGLCLANLGEFSFVMAQVAMGNTLNTADMNQVVSITVVSLLLAPYLVKYAPAIAGLAERFTHRAQPLDTPPVEHPPDEPRPILLVGFGPAAQRVAEALMGQHPAEIVVIELNPRNAATAQRYGLRHVIGSATQPEVLEKAGIHQAQIVIITIPDPQTSQLIITLCRALNPAAQILVRARYHAYRWELQMAGADIVIDEEEQLGQRMAAVVRKTLAHEED